jgi:hypothetical protein
MSEPGDLGLKAQSSFTFFLGELQLARFIVPDICDAYLTTEIPKNVVLGCIHNGCKLIDLPAKFIECTS